MQIDDLEYQCTLTWNFRDTDFFSCSQEILNKKIKFINYLIIQFENMTGNTGKVYEVRKKEKAGV